MIFHGNVHQLKVPSGIQVGNYGGHVNNTSVPNLDEAIAFYQGAVNLPKHGEYEIVCADYKDIDGNGDFELQGTLGIDIMLVVDRTPAKVEAKTITNIDLNVIGLIPF